MWLPSVNICDAVPSHPVAWGFVTPSIRIPAGPDSQGKMLYDIINNNTAWLDLNPVYGTEAATAAALRDPSGGGRLRMDDYDIQVLLPLTGSMGPPGLVPDFANGPVMRNYSGRGWLPSAATTGRRGEGEWGAGEWAGGFHFWLGDGGQGVLLGGGGQGGFTWGWGQGGRDLSSSCL